MAESGVDATAVPSLAGPVNGIIAALCVLIGGWALVRSARVRRVAEEDLRTLLNGAGVGFVVVDPGQQRILFASRPVEAMLGISAGMLAGQTLRSLFPPGVPPIDSPCDLCVTAMRGSAGDLLDVELSCGPTRWAGRPATLIIVRDITERLRAERDHRIAMNAMANMSEAAVIVDSRWRVVTVNRAFTAILGYLRDEVLDRTPVRWLRFGRESGVRRRAILTSLSQSDRWQGELTGRHRDGGDLAIRVSIAAVRDRGGAVTHYVCLFGDNSLAREREMRLRHQANHDVLTDLPNRAALEERATRALARARAEGRQVVLLFLDLDGFKAVNDTWGHAAGDEVLRIMSQRFRASVRSGDFVARIGGDEFNILLDPAPCTDRVLAIARSLLEQASEPVSCFGRMIRLSSSIGISCFPRDGADFGALAASADLAMYEAKRQGRNNVQLYSQQIAISVRQREELGLALRNAIAAGQFGLDYQPIVNMADGALVGLRALLRWNHPTRGAIPPASFVPLAEELGLIDAISDWILTESCTQAAAWQARGLGHRPVAIRLSSRDYRSGRLPERVTAALAKARWPADGLMLEACEETLLQRAREGGNAGLPQAVATFAPGGPDEALARGVAASVDGNLAGLARLGVRLAINGFGSGQISFAHLQGLPAMTLKIDRLLVQQLPAPAALATVRAMVAMVRTLGTTVIAEGVETRAQHEALLAEGCQLGIGFFYGAPMSVAAIERLLVRENCLDPSPELA